MVLDIIVLQISKEHSAADFTSNREDKYELVLGMKDLASRGMAAEVVQEVNAIDPNFFVQNPALLFQLKQVNGSISCMVRNCNLSKGLNETTYMFLYSNL